MNKACFLTSPHLKEFTNLAIPKDRQMIKNQGLVLVKGIHNLL